MTQYVAQFFIYSNLQDLQKCILSKSVILFRVAGAHFCYFGWLSAVPTMDRKGLQVEPADKLRFSGELKKEIRVQLKITNKSDQKQAFKVKCTRNDLFKIRPTMGILDYQQMNNITILYKPKDGETVDDRHHVGVYHIPAPEGCTAESVWSEHYGPPLGEHRIKITFDEHR